MIGVRRIIMVEVMRWISMPLWLLKRPSSNRYGHITLHGVKVDENSIDQSFICYWVTMSRGFSVPLTWTTSCLEGIISMEDLEYEKFGWSVYPFLDRIDIDGIVYSHYFISGVLGKAIGGENPAASILNKQHMSCTSGHTHTYDVAL